MTVLKSGPELIRFDGFEANLGTGELHKAGRKVRLPNQSFSVLSMLLGRAGQLVTREELRARLWPAGTFVEYDQSLNAAVNRLREALRDSAEKPRCIETLPRRGYRFIGVIEREIEETRPPEVAEVTGAGATTATRATVVPATTKSRPFTVLAAVASVVLLIIAGVFLVIH